VILLGVHIEGLLLHINRGKPGEHTRQRAGQHLKERKIEKRKLHQG
jgi:hypothetical protein